MRKRSALWAVAFLTVGILAPVQILSHEKSEPPIWKRISRMTLEEKIGQMFMVALPDTKLSPKSTKWLRDRRIGGVGIHGGNVVSAGQVRALVRDLQKSGRRTSDPPLFIATDQEGGEATRFKFLQEKTPQKEIQDEDSAFRIAERRGKELKDLGINMIFSPVLDISEDEQDFIFERTFPGGAVNVSQLGIATVYGYQASGVIPVIKHFPGHGGTSIDSHQMLPEIPVVSEKEWQERIMPFFSAMASGADVLMTSHIRFLHLDPQFPATLSRAILIDFLRRKLDFGGVVITDELGMGAIMNSYSLEDAAVLAINAGADIILLFNNLEAEGKVYDAVRRAVKDGRILVSRINESVERILLLKEKIKSTRR